MKLDIRRVFTVQDTIDFIAERRLREPYKVSVAAAIIRNPFIGPDSHNLRAHVADFSDTLGDLTVAAAVKGLDGGTPDVFGKAALVGLAGEVFHGSELIHTKTFGDFLRKAAAGGAVVTAAEKLGNPGETIDLSLRYAHDGGGLGSLSVRHLASYPLSIPSGPRADEIAVISVVAIGSRPDWRDEDTFFAT